jgi:8-oxo-dGTP pyrophosphatase MutT (NUDIX family)
MGQKERSSGFVVYRIENGEPVFLLLKSAGDQLWGLAKGKVDPGETDEQAARRELAEEAGMTDFEVRDGFERTVRYNFRRAGKTVEKTVRYFLASVQTGDVRISREHSAFGWFSLEQAREKVVFPNLRQVLEDAWRALGTGRFGAG